jgi:hypothetical protein
MSRKHSGNDPRHAPPPSTIGSSDTPRERAVVPSSGTRAPRPRTRQQIPPSADRAMVYDGEGPGTMSPFIDDEARDIVEHLGGTMREPNYGHDEPNPPDPPAPFRSRG